MGSIPVPTFYVYILVRPNGKPFYVGKGKGSRVFAHESEARSGHRCRKCNTIRKIWRNGGQVQRYIILTTDDEAEALAYEAETIALYGRANLCNQTDGGDGIPGVSAESRAKISASLTGRVLSPETRAKMSAARTAFYADPARRVHKRRERHEGPDGAWIHSPETRAKLSRSGRAYYANPEARAKASAIAKAAAARRKADKDRPD